MKRPVNKMMPLLRYILFLLLIAFYSGCQVLYGQDPRTILSSVQQKFSKVKNYQADINIRTDIPFIKILPVKGKLYFQYPDKLRLKSNSIAILPKQGLDPLFQSLADTNSYTAVLQGEEIMNDIPVYIISILPDADTSDLIHGKLWVAKERQLILKAQMTTRTNGTILSEYFYHRHEDVALPDSVIFTVDTKKFKIPKAVAADINNYKKQQDENQAKNKKGKIFIRISNYIINKGVPEKNFSQDKND